MTIFDAVTVLGDKIGLWDTVCLLKEDGGVLYRRKRTNIFNQEIAVTQSLFNQCVILLPGGRTKGDSLSSVQAWRYYSDRKHKASLVIESLGEPILGGVVGGMEA